MTIRELFNLLRRPVVPQFEELRRPTFNVDRSLLERQQAKARELGENSIKPVGARGVVVDAGDLLSSPKVRADLEAARRLRSWVVEDQPDTGVKPVDYDDLPA